nr:MAG TPA_asm: hypothetical protein [Caudoviricetes sp.]
MFQFYVNIVDLVAVSWKTVAKCFSRCKDKKISAQNHKK